MPKRQYRLILRRNRIKAISYLDKQRDLESFAVATLQEILPGWYMEELFTPPAHRRQGIGKRLVRMIQRAVADRGHNERIYLLPAGKDAIAIKQLRGWYMDLGFREIQRFHTGESVLEWIPR